MEKKSHADNMVGVILATDQHIPKYCCITVSSGREDERALIELPGN